MYTVSQFAKLSGISVRTLHYYDEIGLLKPAYINEAGYRHYSKEQSLILQQILFFRELGFELKQIQNILGQNDFDQLNALKSQQILLHDKITRLKQLIKTITTTITYLEEKQIMENTQLFKGFEAESEQQAKYEKFVEEYLIQKYGRTKYLEIKRGYKDQASVSKDNMKKMHGEFDEICKQLTLLIEKKFKPNSEQVQTIVKKHYELIKKFWTPTKQSYAAHANFITETELKNFYNAYHTKLAQFIAEAIKIFAERNL